MTFGRQLGPSKPELGDKVELVSAVASAFPTQELCCRSVLSKQPGGKAMLAGDRTITERDYMDLLRQYHSLHDVVWRHIGTAEGSQMARGLAGLAMKLDSIKESWWRDPKPGPRAHA